MLGPKHFQQHMGFCSIPLVGWFFKCNCFYSKTESIARHRNASSVSGERELEILSNVTKLPRMNMSVVVSILDLGP